MGRVKAVRKKSKRKQIFFSDGFPYSWQKFPIYIPDINPVPHQLKVIVFDMARTKQIYIFHQVEYVGKFNLETHNPRKDTSIQSGSEGLSYKR